MLRSKATNRLVLYSPPQHLKIERGVPPLMGVPLSRDLKGNQSGLGLGED